MLPISQMIVLCKLSDVKGRRYICLVEINKGLKNEKKRSAFPMDCKLRQPIGGTDPQTF